MFKKGDKVKLIDVKSIDCTCSDCAAFKQYGGVVVLPVNKMRINLNKIKVLSPEDRDGYLMIHDNEIKLMHNALQRLKERYEKKKIKNKKTSVK